MLKITVYESTRDRQRNRSIPLEAISLHSAQRLHACRAFSGHRHHSHDFKKSLKTDPDYPYEPTANWMWYKPEDGY